MKDLPHFLSISVTLALGAIAASGQEFLLQSDWRNTIPGPPPGNTAVSLWSGGNESAVSNGAPSGAPQNANGVHLVSSAIGQITDRVLGSPDGSNSLVAAAGQDLLNGENYQFTLGLGGTVQTNPAVTWTIIFPGGFDLTNGTVYSQNVAGNFDVNDLNSADAALRALLVMNPMDVNAAQQLVLLQEDRMSPLEWSGISALAYADKARLLGLPGPGGTNTEEDYCVELARGYFKQACDVFSQFLSNPSDATLAEGLDPSVGSAVSQQVAQIVDDYLRNLEEYEQASLSDFQIRSLSPFYDPSQQPGSTNLPAATVALLADIDSTQEQIQMRLLQTSPFTSLPAYTSSLAGQIRTMLRQLSQMHNSIVNGNITFIAGASGESTNALLFYSSFSSSFFPIFSTQLTGDGNASTFSLALGLASNFTQYASVQEQAASNVIANVTQLAYDYTSNQAALQQQYASQLINLCGYASVDGNGTPNPDIFFAALPPGLRETTAVSYLTNYSLADTGAIYQEWLALAQAETNLVIANLNLSNTFETMLQQKQVADVIYSNELNLATMYLTNGQQIAAIDLQEGQVQAQADVELAQIQASAAESQSGVSSTLGDIGSAIGDVAAIGSIFGFARPEPRGGVVAHSPSLDNVLSIISGDDDDEDSMDSDDGDDSWDDDDSGGDVASETSDAYDSAATSLQGASVQADTAIQLAQLNGQIAQIQSSEQAEVEYADADQTVQNLALEIDSLQMQAQSQAAAIQVAALNVDQEKSKLATLLLQVPALLQQYVRAATLASDSPAFSSNLLTARNAAMQQANDAFVLAQQWCFLAAQCFNYEDNCSSDVNEKNYLPAVLAARNTGALMPLLNDMAGSNALLAASCQGSVSTAYVPISLRNQIFQQNLTVITGTNAVTFYEPILTNGQVLTNGAASLAAWTRLLQTHLETNTEGTLVRTLLLDFRISLDPDVAGGVPQNPFYSCQNFGETIAPYDNAEVKCNGVQVNISTSGLSLASGTTFTVQLAQNGASTVRNLGYANPGSFLRYFNFGYYAVEPVQASFNDFGGSYGTGAFQFRSPANDDWQLAISDDYPGGPNTTLLNNLNTVTDIQLAFGVQGYTDPVAAFNCTH